MRQYLIGSWNNADSYDYSGEQLMGNRLGASREVPHFTASGKANVAKYGDHTEKKSTVVSIKDKILPQAKRLTTLRQQMVELEQEYKTTDMSISEYSVLRDVLFAKAQRAEVLYHKAIAQKPVQMPEDEAETPYTINVNAQPNDGYASEEYEEIGVVWIDELSADNSLKSFLKFSCKVVRKAVQFSHKARAYWQELKEV